MKRVQITSYGVPEEVARCVEVPDVGMPGAGKVTFEVLAFPINPADVMFCRGAYRIKPPLPATPGAECVGRVLAIGNPPTALLMLTDLVDLRRGEWVLQNAANSAVGKLLIRFARARGLRTVNIVRREASFAELKALGADICLVDGPDLSSQDRPILDGAPIRLALDAVGGHATGRLAALVADGGNVCNYGAMGDESANVNVAYSDLIFRGVSILGFLLGRALAKRSLAELRALYADVAGQVHTDGLWAPVEAVYLIDEIGAALTHAQRPARGGKILVVPNGAV